MAVIRAGGQGGRGGTFLIMTGLAWCRVQVRGGCLVKGREGEGEGKWKGKGRGVKGSVVSCVSAKERDTRSECRVNRKGKGRVLENVI